ncbi:hypothetical protein FGRMN_5700 [Fusarium graminum]|nr:hypothetical protein FGRMN_5700 [Fusarium graminum]
MASYDGKDYEETSSAPDYNIERTPSNDIVAQDTAAHTSQLQRRLGNRQIQLMAVGGSVGSAVFVTIGAGLVYGGPASLLLAFTLYSTIVGLVNNCMAEMAVQYPVPGGFIRMAGHWVDEALGFMISALSVVLKFWRDDIPVAAVVSACIVLYGVINVGAVKWFGEAEFWLSMAKITLFLIVFFFTFITMIGGNPERDAYGFRYWINPGAFAEHIHHGVLGRFEGFLGSLWIAAFTCVGPEYVSMIAGESKLPRVYLKNAFETAYFRFGVFFILLSLCVGIVLPSNDFALMSLVREAEAHDIGAASPFIIAMVNLKIGIVPHIVNGLLVSSIFSGGNTSTFYGTRCLYSLALEGQAPKFLLKCTSFGLPAYCLGILMLFPCLAFLAVSNDSNIVLIWLTHIITAAQIIDHIVISVTFIFFYRACKAQGIDRKTLPYRGRFQPYSAYMSGIFLTCVVLCYGYSILLPDFFTTIGLFTHYTMLFVAPVTFLCWKIAKKTKYIRASEADLVWERPQIDAYEAASEEVPVGFRTEVAQMFGFRKDKRIDKA